MAPARDAEPGGVGEAVRHQVVQAGQDVGPLFLSDRPCHRGGERPAVSLAAARVGVKHREAGRRQPLAP